MSIYLKSERELAIMRNAGRIVATVLEVLKSVVEPGMKTIELDIIAVNEMKRLEADSSFKGYRGFPSRLFLNPLKFGPLPPAREWNS